MARRRSRVRRRSRRRWLLGSILILPVAAASLWFGLKDRSSSSADNLDTEQIATGQVFYNEYCARCHGQDLAGEFGWMDQETGLTNEELEAVEEVFEDVAPAHDASGNTWRHSDETIFQIIKWGPALALGRKSSRMPGSEEKLADEEIWAIIAYLKSHWPSDLQEAQTENAVVQKQ